MARAFQGNVIPDASQLVGMSWLLDHFQLNIPLRELSCLSEKRLDRQRVIRGKWLVHDSQIKVENSATGHFEFSLKHEFFDLLVLKIILSAWSENDLLEYLKQNPKTILRKKIWFLYEFLLNKKLQLEDLPAGKYDDLLDEQKYFTRIAPIKSKRHKINNNLLGISTFCPIIRKTDLLQQFTKKTLNKEISQVVGNVSKSIIRRAASFLMLSDSKASFEIEGERPPKNRVERWGRVINEAGKSELSLKEIERLHAILIQDSRFTQIGLRKEGVFLGDRDHNGDPIPEFIGAKHEDLLTLIRDLLEINLLLTEDEFNPVLQATIIAFAFVYIHPLEDGNGRLHRYLLHHVLGKREYYPKGMIFPISSVILDEINSYRDILVEHSSPLMDLIDWQPNTKGNVEVLNETIDLYRYFDCTKACEFIYRCVETTILKTIPEELKHLDSFDQTFREVHEFIEMPDNEIKSLITFILQNDGKLSKKKREKFFSLMSDEEIMVIEEMVQKHFSC